ncbi:hypothetical protein D1007_43296 [Hordeum vulgare]|nr:hypothetical protein D1007_43296 [Hordeum vulgare]
MGATLDGVVASRARPEYGSGGRRPRGTTRHTTKRGATQGGARARVVGRGAERRLDGRPLGASRHKPANMRASKAWRRAGTREGGQGLELPGRPLDGGLASRTLRVKRPRLTPARSKDGGVAGEPRPVEDSMRRDIVLFCGCGDHDDRRGRGWQRCVSGSSSSRTTM